MRSLIVLCALTLAVLAPMVTMVAAAPGDIKYLVFLHRHGDRAPIDQAPQVTDATFAKQWPLGLGELTAHGMRQLYAVGQNLRATYANFIPTSFSPFAHYTRSTDVHRTMQSAQSLLYGLYSTTSNSPFDPLTNSTLPNNFLPFPVSTVAGSTDTLLLGNDVSTAQCSVYNQAYANLYASTVFTNKAKQDATLLADISRIAGTNVTLGWPLTIINDLWTCDYSHNFISANWPTLTDATRIGAYNLSKWQLDQNNLLPVAAKRLLAGRMIGDILNTFDALIAANGTNSKVSPTHVLHWSAHDTTVMPLLMILNIFDGTPPPYASHVAVELREGNNGMKDAYVRVLYQDTPVVLPFCQNNVNCAYSTVFRPYMSKLALFSDDEYVSLCNSAPVPAPSASSSSLSSRETTLVVVVSGLGIAVLVLAFSLFTVRKKLNAVYRDNANASSPPSASYMSI